MASTDELCVIGLHLEQYRHATRCPTAYWREALRRDPHDARCNNAIGRWHLRRGEFIQAEACFRNAIARLTSRNANPYDGEPFYNLGLCLRFQLESNRQPAFAPLRRAKSAIGNRQWEDSYAAFYKAAWNQAWAAAGYLALAELDCCRNDWTAALDHLDRSLRGNADNLRARNLKAIVLRKLRRQEEAARLLDETLALDRLDPWAKHLAGEPLSGDLQTRLDLAHDCARAGLYEEAIGLLQAATEQQRGKRFARASKSGEGAGNGRDLPDQSLGAAPLIHYTLGWLEEKRGNGRAAMKHFKAGAAWPPHYCFPARLEEMAVFEAARRANPRDARAPYYLGNLLYDRRRHDEAIRFWERSAKLDPDFPVVWRNLGMGYFNVLRQPDRARAAYDRALRANPADARLWYERDQLWKRLGEAPAKRLAELEKRLDLVRQRDDLSVELCALYNQTGRHEEALAWVSSRRFQPWEGGEGGPLGQWVRTNLALGRARLRQAAARPPSSAMQADLLASAAASFRAGLDAPANLGEAKHLLANQSDVHYWLGGALAALGEKEPARRHWRAAATFRGDFQEMRVRAFSEMTYYSALAWERLGQRGKARKLLRDLLAYARTLFRAPAKIDYFATSLPALLLFDGDLQFRQETEALFLQAQAQLGLGKRAAGRRLLKRVLRRDPNHAPAADLLESFEQTRYTMPTV